MTNESKITKAKRNRCLKAHDTFMELRKKVLSGFYKLDAQGAYDLAILVMEMSNENEKIYNIAMGEVVNVKKKDLPFRQPGKTR